MGEYFSVKQGIGTYVFVVTPPGAVDVMVSIDSTTTVIDTGGSVIVFVAVAVTVSTEGTANGGMEYSGHGSTPELMVTVIRPGTVVAAIPVPVTTVRKPDDCPAEPGRKGLCAAGDESCGWSWMALTLSPHAPDGFALLICTGTGEIVKNALLLMCDAS